MSLRTSLALVTVTILLCMMQYAFGLQFHLSKNVECFSQKVENDGDSVRASFVVIRHKSRFHPSTYGVDLVVKGPNGEQVHDDRYKKSEHFGFVARKKGTYQFCFINRSKHSEWVDFNVEVSHHEKEEHAQNEHLTGVKELITKLEDSLHDLLFQQHYLMTDQHRLKELHKATNFWNISKAVAESFALVGSSFLQVYLLKRLFKRQLGE